MKLLNVAVFSINFGGWVSLTHDKVYKLYAHVNLLLLKLHPHISLINIYIH